jgi:ankyrin repeat protein
VVQKTIELGADINATNRGGDSPLHLAAYAFESFPLSLLREQANRHTPRLRSARPYFRLIKLLLENKASVNLRNQCVASY